ncbi:Major intrinsic protein [Dillenia turbinata]|uniref:Major intrinsic protein n=1 Tax=Dillenia turbinata TaxID=194707 RepID=A0AAN8VGD3_9MAGN
MASSGLSQGYLTDLGSPKETIREGLAEFISMLIFVFAGQGSVAVFKSLLVIALANSLALVAAVAVSKNISGGHVNPAVTFGAFVGWNNNVSLFKLAIYWAAQLLGSTIACLLLKLASPKVALHAFALPAKVSAGSPFVLAIVMTFGLVYTVYTTGIEPNRKNMDTIAPLAIGFIVGANILAGGAFDGASMNPAVSFGLALVTGKWHRHWVQWVGSLIGGGLAAVVFECFMARPGPST